MKPIFIYLLQVIMASGILYGYYHYFLRNSRFHQYNRFYLLGSMIVSLVFPFFRIPVYFDTNENIPAIYKVLADVRVGANDEMVSKNLSAGEWLSYIFYGLIAFFFFIRIVLALVRLKRIVRKNSVERINDISFVNTTEEDAPYSFFNWMFWNQRIPLNSEKGQQVFRHECFHIRQRHSWDLMFTEVLSAVIWINPFFHLIRKELKAIHEFLADQYAAAAHDKTSYAELLVMEALRTRQQLVNPFFHNQIKRRIAMIINPATTRYQYMRKLLVLPVAALVLTVVAIRCKSKDDVLVPAKSESLTLEKVSKDAEDSEALAKKLKTLDLKEVKLSLIKEEENKIYEKVEIEAMFPGGQNAWRKFLQQSLNANVPIDKGAPEGEYTVFVQFVVDKNGKISKLMPLSKHGYGMEDEVIRVMKLSPNWSPAIMHGKTVTAYRKQPVTFSITAE